MTDRLIEDYLKKSEIRIKALYLYLEHKDYPDVIRESQEVVELLLKSLLRAAGVEIPKVHDVSRAIENIIDRIPDPVKSNIDLIKRISKTLRKEREICFYGADDFIPMDEYTEEEAREAIKNAEFIYDIVVKSHPEIKRQNI
jgi:HEPN domain-containing protein